MKLLMISGDRSIAAGKPGAFSDMLESFAKHWERIDILCPRGTDADRVARSLFGNVYIHVSPTSLLSQPFFIRSKGSELFKEHAHDVMTVHEYPPFYNGLGARMLMNATKIPTALEIHHIVGLPIASSMIELVGRWMTKAFIGSHANRFDAVRVVNATVKTQLTSFGVDASKITVVPSVYLDHAALDQSKNQPKKFDVVFASRLVDNKGLLETVEAVASLPTVTMLVVGDGPLRMSTEEKVKKLGAQDRIEFTGWLRSSVDVAKAIASGKTFVMNSKSEGNPRVLVEAMALGVSCVSTKVGIAPDIIRDGENGVFSDGTAEDVARKLKTMLADGANLARMGEAAAQVKMRYEKTAAITAYADFLKTLAR